MPFLERRERLTHELGAQRGHVAVAREGQHARAFEPAAHDRELAPLRERQLGRPVLALELLGEPRARLQRAERGERRRRREEGPRASPDEVPRRERELGEGA